MRERAGFDGEKPGRLPCRGRQGYAVRMRVVLPYGLKQLELEVPQSCLIDGRGEPPASALASAGAAIQEALERPAGFPPLRKALTPDDHVTVVVDESLPHLVELLIGLLEHIVRADVAPSAVSLVCSLSSAGQSWLKQLPDEYHDLHCEVHDPANRKRMSYLATTKGGRRLYLNRTVVDADQVVVLSARGYDPLLGYSGAEGSLFPAFSDEATIQEMADHLTHAIPGPKPWRAKQEAAEAAWLLGAPFFVQVIPGAGDEIIHVLAGLADSCPEGERMLDARWRRTFPQRAHTVVATVSGDPARQGFSELARAAECASRVVRPDGRIIILSEIKPELGPAEDVFCSAETPEHALALLMDKKPRDRAAAYQWASAASAAKIYLFSGLSADAAEDLFAVALDDASRIGRMLAEQETVLVLPDAHRTLAVLE